MNSKLVTEVTTWASVTMSMAPTFQAWAPRRTSPCRRRSQDIFRATRPRCGSRSSCTPSLAARPRPAGFAHRQSCVSSSLSEAIMVPIRTRFTPVLDYRRPISPGKGPVTLAHGRSIAARLSDGPRSVPPTAHVLLGIASAQLGAAIAKNLLESLGPGGTVFLRIAFATLMLLVLVRPKLGGHDRNAYLVAGLFGLALALMNLSIYLAIDRIPLGVAVTLEFVGTLGVAVAGSRRALN